MGTGRELLVWLWCVVQDVHLIVLVVTEGGGARGRQQDELGEAVQVGHAAEGLQYQHHEDQAQEEVDWEEGAAVG